MQDLIALGIVVVTSWWLFRHFTRMAKSGKCSGCDHTQDTQAGATGAARGLKRTPLVSPEQVGLPPSSGAGGTKE